MLVHLLTWLCYRYLRVECGEDKDTKAAQLYSKVIKRYVRTLFEVCFSRTCHVRIYLVDGIHSW